MINHLQAATTLNNGVKMPWFGLGVYKAQDGEEVVAAVKAAVRLGYRSIDTAAIYRNEDGVGRAVRELVEEGAVKREELFITTKVWNADQGYDTTLEACDASLRRLGLDYVDLYLIHWPVKGKYIETWPAMEKLYKDGKARSVGVSNFHIHHLEDLRLFEVVPAVNQVEYHPWLGQKELLTYCRDRGIRLEAWSPLAQGRILDNPELGRIAAKHGKTAAQVVLRWDLQNGVVTIPKSVTERRLAENANVFDFALDDADMTAIDALNTGTRVGPDPDNFDF